MGRFGTALIITLALGGATVEGFAAQAQTSPTGVVAAPAAVAAPMPPAPGDRAPGNRAPGTPVGMLLADAATGGPADAGPGDAPPPPPPGGPGRDGPGFGGPGHDGPPGFGDRHGPPFAMGWKHHDMMARLHDDLRNWGLFYPQRDKNLSVADVQVLAQAILLSHGNHDWKVVNVADGGDGRIGFAYATADGTVIAKFAIDPHSGHVARTG